VKPRPRKTFQVAVRSTTTEEPIVSGKVHVRSSRQQELAENAAGIPVGMLRGNLGCAFNAKGIFIGGVDDRLSGLSMELTGPFPSNVTFAAEGGRKRSLRDH